MHILIADDDPVARAAALAVLVSLGHRCRVAADGTEAWGLYCEQRPDVLLTDWQMPGIDGTSLTERVRADAADPYTYILMLTGQAGSAEALDAMRAGVDDVITKPCRPAEIERKLVGAARLIALRSRADTVSRQDSLTGVGNRRRLVDDLRVLRARRQRYGHLTWLIRLELENFAAYREAVGHVPAGKVLQSIAATLAEQVRTRGSVYREGVYREGDQFMVTVSAGSGEEAADAAGRLRVALDRLAIGCPDSGRVTASTEVIEITAESPGADAATARRAITGVPGDR